MRPVRSGTLGESLTAVEAADAHVLLPRVLLRLHEAGGAVEAVVGMLTAAPARSGIEIWIAVNAHNNGIFITPGREKERK